MDHCIGFSLLLIPAVWHCGDSQMDGLTSLSMRLCGSSPELMVPERSAVQVLDLNPGTMASSTASTLRLCLAASLAEVWHQAQSSEPLACRSSTYPRVQGSVCLVLSSTLSGTGPLQGGLHK